MIFGLDTENDLQGRCTIICACSRTKRYIFKPGPVAVGELTRILSKESEIEPVHVWTINLEYDLVNLYGSSIIDFCTLYFGRSRIVGGILRGCDVKFFDVGKFIPRKSAQKIGEALNFKKIQVNQKDLVNNKLPYDQLAKYCMRDSQIARKAGEAIEAELKSKGVRL